MPSAQKTVLINRPAGEVFAFIADGGNDPKWRPDVIDIAHVPGTGTGLGARYRQGVKGPASRTQCRKSANSPPSIHDGHRSITTRRATESRANPEQPNRPIR
jgi:polyketide cyclase/dehydrase/lipid transport protein